MYIRSTSLTIQIDNMWKYCIKSNFIIFIIVYKEKKGKVWCKYRFMFCLKFFFCLFESTIDKKTQTFIYNKCMKQNHFYPSYVTCTSKVWRINVQSIESSIKRLKRSIHFQKSITIFQNIKKQQNNNNNNKKPQAVRNSKYICFSTTRYIIWIWLISKHFEKQIFLSYKVNWRGPKFNALLKKNQIAL